MKELLKKSLIIVLLPLVLISCSKKEEEKSETKTEVKMETEVKKQSTGKIEITQSENVYEKKTEEKVKTEDKAYYYSYAKKEKENSFTKEAKSFTELDANVRIRSPYEKVQISMLVKGLSKNFIVKCSSCHNNYANGIIGPSLLKKDEASIYKSIMDFKNENKKNILMKKLVKNMSDKEIKQIAKEISVFNEKVRELK